MNLQVDRLIRTAPGKGDLNAVTVLPRAAHARFLVLHRGLNEAARCVCVIEGALEHLLISSIRSKRFRTSGRVHFHVHLVVLRAPLLKKNAAIIDINRFAGAALSSLQLRFESRHPEVILQPPVGSQLGNRTGKRVLGSVRCIEAGQLDCHRRGVYRVSVDVNKPGSLRDGGRDEVLTTSLG